MKTGQFLKVSGVPRHKRMLAYSVIGACFLYALLIEPLIAPYLRIREMERFARESARNLRP